VRDAAIEAQKFVVKGYLFKKGLKIIVPPVGRKTGNSLNK